MDPDPLHPLSKALGLYRSVKIAPGAVGPWNKATPGLPDNLPIITVRMAWAYAD